jgi:uncharacterized protein with HEPN domain
MPSMPEETAHDRIALLEIVEAADLIAEFVVGFDLDRFLADPRTCNAVAMQVFVLTEATVQLSEEARVSLGELPWKQIRSLRNRIAHGYFSVDFSLLWTIATGDVPGLALAARRVLGNDPELRET